MRFSCAALYNAAVELGRWQAAGRTFRFGAHDIFYRDEGAGPALLCVHGFPTASWDWHRLWPALTARFRVIAPDMLGFGFSAKPRGHAYAIHEQATLHEALLAALGVDAVDVFAHDYGDTVAQELLARFSERRAAGAEGLALRSCCFLNGGLFPELHRPILIQKLLRSPAGALVARLSNERTFHRSFSRVFGPRTKPTPDELHAAWTLFSRDGGKGIAHLLIRYIDDRLAHRDRWVGVLERPPVPLRLVNGPEDPVSGRHAAERFREVVPGGDVVLLEGIGHYPQLEDPERTLAAFLAFHERLGGGASG